MSGFSDPGPLPELAWLPVEKLRVNLDYQRIIGTPRSQALIHQIAQDFRWLAFQSIQATPDNEGGWYVIDGQHRVEAARRRGITHVPATVVSAATVAEQADAFVQANRNRIPINQFAAFHALVASNEKVAVCLAGILAKAEITVPRSQPSATSMPPGITLAIGKLLELARRHGEKAALPIACVADAYRGIPGALRSPFFDGATRFIFSVADQKEGARHAMRFFKSKAPDELAATMTLAIGDKGGQIARGQAIADLIRASLPAGAFAATKPTKPIPQGPKKIAEPAVKAKTPAASIPPRSRAKSTAAHSSSPALPIRPVVRRVENIRPDEDAAIATFIKRNGVSTSVDFGIHQKIVDAARDVCGFDVARARSFNGKAAWLLNNGRCDTREFYKRVNFDLERRGKKPIEMPKPAHAGEAAE
jgi:hypothetical protein